MKASDEHLLSTLAVHYQIRSTHGEFREKFGERFNYAVPSRRAGFSRINPKGPEPRDYVVFARADLRRGDEQACINALSNAKRAVHLTVESLVQIYCLSRFARKAGFPGLLGLLQKIEAFPTRLMANLNRRRNEVEHEYAAPSPDESAEFVEMAELFVGLAYNFFRGAVIGTYVGEDGACREYRIEPPNLLVVFTVKPSTELATTDGVIQYNISRNTPRDLVRQIPIDAEHETDWQPILRLFAHCTNSDSFRLGDLGRPGEIVPTTSELYISSELDERGRTSVKVSHTTYAPGLAEE